MSSSLRNTITELVHENRELRQRHADEKAPRLSLEAREKERGKELRDLGEEITRLKGLLDRWGRKTAVAFTPKKITSTEMRPNTPMTPVSPIPFKLGRKREGGEGDGSGLLSRVVEVAEGKRRKVEEEVGTRVDPEKEQGKGPVVGLKVGGVAWLVGVEGVVDELGRMGIVICEGSRWLVDENERSRRMKERKASSTVVALVRGGKEVDALFRSGVWLAGRWCSIKRFVSIKPVRKVDRWRQVKVALEANRRRVEKVFGLVEAFMGVEEEEEIESITSEERYGEMMEEKVERLRGKGKGVETGAPRKEEKEEKVGFESGVKWERGSLFGEPSDLRKEAKADLDWAAGLGKLKVTEVGDMGYCNSCRKMGGAIGGACKRCKMRLV